MFEIRFNIEFLFLFFFVTIPLIIIFDRIKEIRKEKKKRKAILKFLRRSN